VPDLPDRRKHEEELAAALLLVFEPFAKSVITSPDSVPWGEFRRRIQQAAAGPLESAFLASATALSGENGQFSVAGGDFSGEAQAWAGNFSGSLATEISDITRQRVEAVQGAGIGTLLLTVLGPDRATRIAATEITRAATAGEHAVTAGFNMQTGQTVEPIWYTEADGLVCPVCAPLHGQPQGVFGRVSPAGPPAHPNCRCWLDWKAI